MVWKQKGADNKQKDAEKIIIEIKSTPYLTKADEKQLWYYLKSTHYKIAFLVNFGGRELEIKRWIYDKAREKYSA